MFSSLANVLFQPWEKNNTGDGSVCHTEKAVLPVRSVTAKPKEAGLEKIWILTPCKAYVWEQTAS